MKAYEFIIESKSADIYHGTTLRRAEQIISSDTFIANTPMHSDTLPNSKNGATRTVSFSRSNRAMYKFAGGDHPTDIGVVLVMDQSLMSRDLGKRMVPYDDMNTSWYQLQQNRYSDTLQDTTSARSRGANESEELVFGNITRANKYIKKIVIFITMAEGTTESYADEKIALLKKSPIFKDPRTLITGTGSIFMRPREFINLYSKHSSDNNN